MWNNMQQLKHQYYIDEFFRLQTFPFNHSFQNLKLNSHKKRLLWITSLKNRNYRTR